MAWTLPGWVRSAKLRLPLCQLHARRCVAQRPPAPHKLIGAKVLLTLIQLAVDKDVQLSQAARLDLQVYLSAP